MNARADIGASCPDRPDVLRLERAMIAIARIVAGHGEAYAPIFDRIEAELDAARRRVPAAERAAIILRQAGLAP